jgi:hypothetical protein
MKRLIIIMMALTAIGVVGLTGCAKDKPSAQVEVKKTIYTCPMHHQIRRDKPGECPICTMTLIPLEEAGVTPEASPSEMKSGQPQVKKVKYWANPMHPAQHSAKPMKDDMGMDYVPVYEEVEASAGAALPEEIKGLAPVHISPYKEQLIDVKFATAQKAAITRVIRTVGRLAGGEGDFAALAGDFAAQKPLHSSGQYVVADIYALDLPFVKVGQKAFVTSLSGSGFRVPGRVALVYPYDGTQSRVTRVRINLAEAAPPGIFANVEIEATTPLRLSVPPTAVMDTGTKRYVFVQTSMGTFTPQEIKTGYEGNDLWEVTSGLKEGDQVVDGALYLIDADSKLKAAFAETK